MSSLVRGKWVIQGSGTNRRILEDGAIYVEDDKIKDIDAYDLLKKKHRPDFEYGSDNHVVMPGLINSHNHGNGVTSLQRGIGDGPLELWILESHMKEDFGANPYNNALLSSLKQIENGITCTLHHFYGHTDVQDFENYLIEVKQGIQGDIDAGIRVAFAPSISNQNRYTYMDSRFVANAPKKLKQYFDMRVWSKEETTSRSELYLKAFRTLHENLNDHRGCVHVLLGPTNVPWCSDDLLIRIKQTASKLNTGIHMHLVETMYQMLHSIKELKETAPRHLSRLSFLGKEVSLAHAIWLQKHDLRVLQKSGVTCVHNPSSNLRLSSGICPALKMKEAGISMAIGTDGTGINDDDDMFQEMRLASLLHRVPGLNSNGLAAEDILDMATVRGARVTGWPNEIGALEVGRRADIILVDTRRFCTPVLSSNVSLIEDLVQCCKGSDVDTVMINGEIVMEHRRFLKWNKEKICDELRRRREADTGMNAQIEELKQTVKKAYRTWDRKKLRYRYNMFA